MKNQLVKTTNQIVFDAGSEIKEPNKRWVAVDNLLKFIKGNKYTFNELGEECISVEDLESLLNEV